MHYNYYTLGIHFITVRLKYNLCLWTLTGGIVVCDKSTGNRILGTPFDGKLNTRHSCGNNNKVRRGMREGMKHVVKKCTQSVFHNPSSRDTVQIHSQFWWIGASRSLHNIFIVIFT